MSKEDAFDEARLAGQRLLADLQDPRGAPIYARALPRVPRSVPPNLACACEDIRSGRSGAGAFVRQLLSAVAGDARATGSCTAPNEGRAMGRAFDAAAFNEERTRFYSGDQDNIARFASSDVAEFFAGLFHHIARSSGCTLTSYDLYHGHCFVQTDGLLGGSAAGGPAVGVLFHAKEHPKELSHSCDAIHPIGSQAAGGARDQRIGTQLSIFDTGFSERNFVWLASTNTVHTLLPEHPDFPCGMLGSAGVRHFYTVDSSNAFGPNCFDINYLHLGCAPEVDSTGLPPCPAACVATVYSRHRHVLGSSGASQPASPDPMPTPEQQAAAVHQLVAQGFGRSMAQIAVERCQANVYRAGRLAEAARALQPCRFVRTHLAAANRVELAHAAMEALGALLSLIATPGACLTPPHPVFNY